MKKQDVLAPLQLLDYADYNHYLVPESGRIVAKELPLPAGHEVIKTDYVRLRFSGLQLQPTIPANSIIRGQVISLASITKLDSGLYAALMREGDSNRVTDIQYGRLKSKPTQSTMTLWPDNPAFSKRAVPIRKIAFLFRILEYRPIETTN